MITRTVLVDIDNTLTDTLSAMLRYINTKSKRRYHYKELTLEFREADGGEYYTLLVEFLERPELVYACPPYEDARAALIRLKEAGYNVHIASARRESLHDVTLKWLADHGFTEHIAKFHPRFSHQQGREFKREVAEQVKPVAAFDDTFDVAEAVASTGTTVYLVDEPWTRGIKLPDNIIRAPSFAKAVDEFLDD